MLVPMSAITPVGLSHVFRQIEAIEPHPVLFHVLMANMLRNNVAHMHCHNFGLAGEDAQGSLVESNENHGLSKIKERSQLPASVFGLTDESFAANFPSNCVPPMSSYHSSVPICPSPSSRSMSEGMEQEILRRSCRLSNSIVPSSALNGSPSRSQSWTDIALSLDGLHSVRYPDDGYRAQFHQTRIAAYDTRALLHAGEAGARKAG